MLTDKTIEALLGRGRNIRIAYSGNNKAGVNTQSLAKGIAVVPIVLDVVPPAEGRGRLRSSGRGTSQLQKQDGDPSQIASPA